MRDNDFHNIAQLMFKFEYFLQELEGYKLSKSSQELLINIYNEWAKHKLKDPDNKKIAGLIQGFASYFNERISVDSKSTKT